MTFAQLFALMVGWVAFIVLASWCAHVLVCAGGACT